MESHLEAAQALKQMLQQATVGPSDRPSQLDWSTLFDAHVINLENHAIILNKVLSITGIADPLRKEIEAMRTMGEQSRQAAFGLKGLLVLHGSGIMGLSELISPTKFSTSNAEAPGQIPSTSTPSNVRIKIRNLPENCTAQTLKHMFRDYEATNCCFMKDAQDCPYAVLTVPSGRMQLIACSEMNGRKYEQNSILVDPIGEKPEKASGPATQHNSSNPQPARPSAAADSTTTTTNQTTDSHTSTTLGKEKRKAEQELVKDFEPPTKKFQGKQPGARVPEAPEPVEYDDISDEVQRRLKDKEQKRQREKEQRMQPAGRKRMRDSFESADFLLEAEPSPESKRVRDNVMSLEPVHNANGA